MEKLQYLKKTLINKSPSKTCYKPYNKTLAYASKKQKLPSTTTRTKTKTTQPIQAT